MTKNNKKNLINHKHFNFMLKKKTKWLHMQDLWFKKNKKMKLKCKNNWIYYVKKIKTNSILMLGIKNKL